MNPPRSVNDINGQKNGFDWFAASEASPQSETGVPPTPQPASALQPLPSCSDNPLVKAATRLLNLLVRIRMTSMVSDTAALRQSLMDEMRFFEEQALAANVSRDEIIGARYCLCTALDEAAGQTPWGGGGVWARYSLLVTYHNETHGGEKYYQLLSRLAQYPERHRCLIELLYYCNMLGFEGKFRVLENGHAQLEILKRRIATLLNAANAHEQRLSLHWQGEQTQRELWRMIPPWVVATCCALIAFAVYLWLNFSLEAASNPPFLRLSSLELPAVKQLEQAPQRPPIRPLRFFLEPEIRQGLIEVLDHEMGSLIRLKGDGLFASGSSEVHRNYLPLIKRIAKALDDVDGRVLITGHSDNVPIRKSVRFASNQQLSEARARAVATLLRQGMQRTKPISVAGAGEGQPLVSNDTPAGRARNRRVEITLRLSAAEIQRQLNPQAGAALQ